MAVDTPEPCSVQVFRHLPAPLPSRWTTPVPLLTAVECRPCARTASVGLDDVPTPTEQKVIAVARPGKHAWADKEAGMPDWDELPPTPDRAASREAITHT